MNHLTLPLIFIFSFCFLHGPQADAYEEQWSIIQVRSKIDESNALLTEYVRRDRGELLENKFLDLVRLSWVKPVGSWSVLFGGAYVDFKTGANETRLNQFATRSIEVNERLKFFFRQGLEARTFFQDSHLYWRARLRLQSNFAITEHFSLAAYDEVFYKFNGYQKFHAGINENRAGYGINLKHKNIDIYLYNVHAELRSTAGMQFSQWQQLQLIFNY